MDRANTVVDNHGWSKRVVLAEATRDSAGKPFLLLDPEESHKLYQRAHRARLAVLTTSDVWVQLDPSRHRLDKRYLAPISRVFRYKAFVERISHDNLDSIVDRYVAWMNQIGCHDERDSRVLPLHTFCPSTDWADLDDSSGRKRFVKKHGRPSQRTCEQLLQWSPDLGRDGGREPQQVAGRELSLGYHWDVAGNRTKAHLWTFTDVWRLNRGDHVNVYPNGHIRGGENAKKVASVRVGSKHNKK